MNRDMNDSLLQFWSVVILMNYSARPTAARINEDATTFCKQLADFPEFVQILRPCSH